MPVSTRSVLMLGVFTDQAHNLILLSEDEARMLGRPVVEPQHLLLALTRHLRDASPRAR